MLNGRILECKRLSKRFGGVRALHDADLHVHEGEMAGLIGPNGAGKTTVFDIVSGAYCPENGHVLFRGSRITGWRPDRISSAGIARTFQNLRLFNELTVLDNVRLACHRRIRYGFLSAVLRTKRYHECEAEIDNLSRELLELLDLSDRADDLAHSLPYGDQRKLEIARALATRPRLVLFDEPAAGMNAEEKADLAELVRRLRDQFELTLLLVDHDMSFIMPLCERVVVLDQGQILAEGTPSDVQKNPEVIRTYLGDNCCAGN